MYLSVNRIKDSRISGPKVDQKSHNQAHGPYTLKFRTSRILSVALEIEKDWERFKVDQKSHNQAGSYTLKLRTETDLTQTRNLTAKLLAHLARGPLPRAHTVIKAVTRLMMREYISRLKQTLKYLCKSGCIKSNPS